MHLTRAASLFARLSCTLVVAVAVAQTPPVPRPDLGAPGEEHRRLAALEGVFDVSLRIPTGPDKHVEGRSSCKAAWVMDGRFLRLEYASTFAGKPLSVVRYLGFDRHQQKYVELQLESTHTDVMHCEGDLAPDGKSIICQGTHRDAATGKEMQVRTVTTFVDKDAFTLAVGYTDPASKETRTITMTHKRRADAAEAPSLYRVIFQVPDLDAAAGLYAQLFGAKGRRVSPGRHYFDCGPVILALVDPSFDEEKPKPTPDFSYFAVQDLEAMHAKVKALGWLSKEQVHGAPAGEIVKRPWGERSFYAFDPYGNRLCFVDAKTVFTGR
jgi:catechol 2,3-dioxygenase-like lactoylglutathione lyase family enzyme